MNKLLIPTLALVLMGQGCLGFGSAPETAPTEDASMEEDAAMEEELTLDFATTPDRAFAILENAAKKKDCETFLELMTERLELTEEDCFEAALQFGTGTPEIDWDATEYEDNTAKVMMANGRTLTTFIQGEGGLWRADTVFWK